MSAASERDFFAEVRRERDAEKRAATFDNNPNDIALALLAAEDVITGLEGRIVELEEGVKHLACPVCGTVNPPEVHTCTPRPKVTVVLNEWAVVNKNNWIVERIRGGDGSSNNEYRERYDSAIPYDAPHTVKRVALIDEPTTRGEG